MAHGRCQPEPGDLIEIDRPLYQHWALYVGDGYVINVTPVGKNDVKLGVHKVTVLTRKVKKQLLKEVVGKDKWSPNNKSDKYYTPLPVEIIQRAEGYIGKEVTYRVFGSNCENFVKKLRYGDQRVFVHGEVHIPDMTSDNCHPKPGDLIECTWYGGKCWALYVGDGYVIHVTVSLVEEEAPPLSVSSMSIYTTIVKKELLQEVVKRGKWCVKNKYDCHHPPLPVEEIIRRAECYVGKEVPRRFLGTYSEHLMAKFRYGGQAIGDHEMHAPDMRQDKYYPRPGDLIEIKQIDCPQWAVYVGCEYVIHVAAVDENAAPVSASTETSFTGKAVVKVELLKEVTRHFYWEVNNKSDCRYPPVPVEEIIWRAGGYIGKEVPYRFFLSKSEHFVKKLRYGDQASLALRCFYYFSAAAAGIGAIGVSAVTTLPVVAAAGVSFIANLGFASGNVVHSISCAKFFKAEKDILQQMCC